MLYKYTEFKVEKLLNDHPENKEILDDLRAQLREMIEAELRAKPESVGERKQTNDGIVNLLVRKEDLERKVADYADTVERTEAALNRLTEEERLVIDCFFYKSMSRGQAQIWLERKLHISQSEVYRRRRAALDKIQRLLWG
ncbi:MAG: hypothetical protein Q4C22_04185 [Bacillota bacterium]|nr:hypothetical protein [Bacillota bacterium]